MTTNHKKTNLAPIGSLAQTSKTLLSDIRNLIHRTKQGVAQTVNAGLVLLYWSIGKRIYQDVLGQKRAEYGEKIVQTLSGQLSWSHFVEIIALKDPLQREFYAEMCRIERWNVRTLRSLGFEGIEGGK